MRLSSLYRSDFSPCHATSAAKTNKTDIKLISVIKILIIFMNFQANQNQFDENGTKLFILISFRLSVLIWFMWFIIKYLKAINYHR